VDISGGELVQFVDHTIFKVLPTHFSLQMGDSRPFY